VPVLFVWGSEDWARPSERLHDESLVSGAAAVTIAGGGHFLPLDKPDAVISHLKNIANQSRSETSA
jgi:pimeloyl-ACP methyl ester carboxylesterase